VSRKRKPTAGEIACVKSLIEASSFRGDDPIARCNGCGMAMPDGFDVWRECDTTDKPKPGAAALLFVGRTSSHALCRKAIDDHPRLYVQVGGAEQHPGIFSLLCGPCVHRKGVECSHADQKRLGGTGLAVNFDAPQGFTCSRDRGGCQPLPKTALRCAGRRTLKLLPSSGEP
jgi:hypothetical protein